MSESIYRRLEVWKEAMRLAVETYRVTQTFPRHELYGITSQIRRAAVSVPSNIAEGRGRGSKRDFCRFAMQARGSLFELQTQLTISATLQYATRESLAQLMKQSETVSRLLNGLIRYLTKGSDSVFATPHPQLPTPSVIYRKS
ncbi:MAG: four helix bundle protein [Thermoanaerobaculia bacterium]